MTVAFTWNGLRALGVDEASLATFPEEFKQGMVARAEMLGDTGAIIPTTGWAGWPARTCTPSRSCSPAIARERSAAVGAREAASRAARAWSCSRRSTSTPRPPFDYAHDHFGYRDRLSQPVIEGSGDEPTPGSGAPLKAGEFILGYPDEDGLVPALPQPEILSRNGSYMAYRRLEEHVGRVPRLPREHGRHARGAGAGGRQAHGPLAQRRPAGPGAGEGRSGAGRRPAAQQRLQLQGDGPARLRRAAGLAHPPHEPARHGGEHEPAPHDPPRGHLRPARCPRTRRRTARSAGSRPS